MQIVLQQIEIDSLKKRNAELLQLVSEIYNWTAYKQTAWSIRAKAAIEENE